MNPTTLSFIVMYAVAAIILVICVLKDMHRSIFRAAVALGLACLAIPLAILLTHNTLDRLTLKLLHTINLEIIAPVTEAFPSLEEGVVALVHMVIASEIYRLVFLILVAVLALIGHFVCNLIEEKKPALAKRSKPIGAAIGAVFGVVMIVAIMAPTAGYAAEAPEVIHILGEYEQISHEGAEDMSDGAVEVQVQAQKASDTLLLKAVRALGGRAIFRVTTTVEIDGVETDLYTEFHALDALGADIAVLSAVPVDQYGDKEYDTLKSVGDVFEHSALLRVLGAEGLSGLSQAWLKGEDFIGIPKPDMGAGMNVALDAAMIVLKDTTKETVARDVRALTPAVSAALRAFNTLQNVTGGDSTGTEDGGEASGSTGMGSILDGDNIGKLVEAIAEAADSQESKDALLKAGIGLVAKELESVFVTEGKPAEETTPSEGATPGEGSEGDGEVVAPDLPDVIPEEIKISKEEYDAFVAHLTNLALTGKLRGDVATVLEQVKQIRDTVGIAISDEACEELVRNVVEGPYAALFQ